MVKQIELATKLDGAASKALVESLTATEGDDIELDGSKVEMIGALCLEAILSSQHLWSQQGLKVELINPSEQLVENLGRFGLDQAKLNTGDVA